MGSKVMTTRFIASVTVGQDQNSSTRPQPYLD